MLTSSFLALLYVPLALAQSTETVLGLYLFHRHGDRTSKSTPPANLTVLGYDQIYSSGEYFRNRYIASNASSKIRGVNTDLVRNSQLAVSAPLDTVLQNSALAFTQSLYPPVGGVASTETLHNGTKVTAPLDGYQLIPISIVSSGSGAEDNAWLQSSTGCGAATTSSNNFFNSEQYKDLLSSTQSFYSSLSPVINGTFTSSQTSFKNAYTIFDLINVAEINNGTINGSDLLTSEVLFQLRTLADTHEWGLAYNASDDMRAVAGKVLAGEVVQALNTTITSKGKVPLNIQFGAYGTFASFFGLAGLSAINPDFYGVADYASVMAFEMFTNSSTTTYPSSDQVYVRFSFRNGTGNSTYELTEYPLFGTGQTALSFNDFTTGMQNFAIGNTEQWCKACGNSTGICAPYAPSGDSTNADSSSSSGESGYAGNGLSPAVNGVIGAMVTLAVVLLIEALILLIGGLRVVSKKRLAGTQVNGSHVPKAETS